MSTVIVRPIKGPVYAGFSGLSGLGQASTGPLSVMEDKYMVLRSKCVEQYGADFCNAVLPRSMVYAITRRDEGYSLPWWVWMLLGLLVGRLLRV